MIRPPATKAEVKRNVFYQPMKNGPTYSTKWKCQECINIYNREYIRRCRENTKKVRGVLVKENAPRVRKSRRNCYSAPTKSKFKNRSMDMRSTKLKIITVFFFVKNTIFNPGTECCPSRNERQSYSSKS